MQLPSTISAAPSGTGYAKVDKMDAEEARHVKAQYLIHKVLEEEEASASARPQRRPQAVARIGVRLKKLRLAIRGARARARRAVRRHLGNLRRLVAHGRRRGSVRPETVAPTRAEAPRRALPAPAAVA